MTQINLKAILKIVGLILLITSASFLFCIPVALFYDETLWPFLLSSVVTLVPGLILYFLIRYSLNEKVSTREGYLGVTLAWVTMVLCGTLPYLFSGVITDFIKALFESTSGYTTTGASIIADVESVPRSILF